MPRSGFLGRGAWWRALLVVVPVVAGVSLVAALVRVTDDGSGAVAEAPPLTAPAEQGFVERQLKLNSSVSWSTVGVLVSGADGVITSITPTVLVGEGDVLLSVDLVDMVVAEGEVPMFRNLRRGIEGTDVAQLQAMLARADLYAGEVDGVFDRQTERAVRGWQEDRRFTTAGVVSLGELIFAKQLPARVRLMDSAVTGGSLRSGDTVAEILNPEPLFVVPVQEAQTALAEVGMTATITVGDDVLEATISGFRVAEDRGESVIDLGLLAPCQTTCDALDTSGESRFPVVIDLVPRTDGVVVPSLALQLSPQGTTVVQLATGETVEVREVASSGGRSVVEGISAGDQVVLIPGEQG